MEYRCLLKETRHSDGFCIAGIGLTSGSLYDDAIAQNGKICNIIFSG